MVFVIHWHESAMDLHVCRVFYHGLSDGCEVIPYYRFDLNFSSNWWCWVSFHVHIAHLYVFFGELSFQILWPFENWVVFFLLFCFVFPFIFISWRLITLQYCSGFCHTLTWISHGFTCIPHPNPPSHLPLYPIPLGLPSAPGLSTCLMHPTWAGDLFHPR